SRHLGAMAGPTRKISTTWTVPRLSCPAMCSSPMTAYSRWPGPVVCHVVVAMTGRRWGSANVWAGLEVSLVRRVRVPFRTSEPMLPPGEMTGEESRRRRRARWAWAAGLAGAAVVLFVAYLRLSNTYAATSDGADQALQGWDML